MTYELYINDVLCDLSGDETLTLVYQSPIFSELDIIQSNRSYNISLPMTERNMRAIEHSQRTDVDSDVPYKRLAARLYQDGVALFDKGVAVITSIADTIDVTLTWGNVDNFQTLFDADMSDLADTLYSMGLGNIAWNEDIKRVTPPNHRDLGYFYVDFGMGVSSYPECLHPCIGLDKVIEAIETYNGIKIADKARLYGHGNYPDLVPLVSENGDKNSNEVEKTTIQPSIDMFSSKKREVLYFNRYATDTDRREISEIVLVENSLTPISIVRAVSFDCGGTDNAFLQIYSPVGDSFPVEIAQYIQPSAPDKITISVVGTTGSYPNKYDTLFSQDSTTKVGNSYYFQNINQKIDVSKYDKIFIIITFPFEYYVKQTILSVYVVLNVIVSVYFDWDDIVYPTMFPVAPNLPDMSQGDFISALLAREGLFAYADLEEPNTIRLMSVDDIVAKLNKSDFVDWSGKVILNDSRRVDMPNGSEFEIEDYAQKNTLDYDNDDDVKAKTEGVITIENEKLERENEAVSLPFSASDNTSENGIECAIIRMFSTSESSDRIDYTEPSPRILTQNEYKPETDGQTGEYVGIFTREQYFGGEQGIVATKYKTLQDILRRFRMITVNARLSPVDLRQLDYTRPVYISQFASMFAIYSIETGENNVSECKLIQLKMDSVLPVTYFLTLNGKEQDYTLADISSEGLSVLVPFDTNGTLVAEYDDEQGMISGGFINAVEKYIRLLVDTNITASERTATLKLTISEDASVARNIVLSQQAAQPLSKTIAGRVTNQSGSALSLATVKVGDLGTGTTTSTGRFSISISEIPGQRVDITASRIGYFTKTVSVVVDSSTIQDVGTIQLESTVITIKTVKLYCSDFSSTTKDVTFSIKDTAYSATMSLSFDSTGNVSVNQNTLARNLGITSMKDYVGSILKAEAAGNYAGTAEIYDGDFGIIMQSIAPVSDVPVDPGEEGTPEEPTETPEIN
jgi:hypothetical protein